MGGKCVVQFIKYYFFLDLARLELSLVMVDPIFAINGSQLH